MNKERKSGILLHPTSLPGNYGMGELGKEAYQFIDNLSYMQQSYWQILPLGPTGYGNSPYQSLSSFAGNTLMISLEQLVQDELMGDDFIAGVPEFSTDHIDFSKVLPYRKDCLAYASSVFKLHASKALKKEFSRFCSVNDYWLEDYSLFIALKESFDLRPWTEWPTALRDRDKEAMEEVRLSHNDNIMAVKVRQFLFDRQWKALKKYANDKQIEIIGDIPIFAAHDSADVWANRELFFLDEQGYPTVVAGVPPDYFSATGQRWGNPLYDWEKHKATGYKWWIARLERLFELTDMIRIDHFRAFEAYWEIPAHEETAINGTWKPVDGYSFFDAIFKAIGDKPIIAENLGIITDEVEKLREHYGFPGMRISQFGFEGPDQPQDLKPQFFPENNVAYTGTHDNDTTVGWFNAQGDDGGDTRDEGIVAMEHQRIIELMGTTGEEIHWDMINVTLKSDAKTAILPMQDLLGLGSEARMNTPGTSEGNWEWRYTRDQLTNEIMDRMRNIALDSERI